jgi:uncharacterized protein
MKVSIYNLFFPFDGKYIVFNTLKGSILLLDPEMKQILEKGDISSIDEEFKTMFRETGIIVDERLCEQDKQKVRYEQSKYDVSSMHFSLITTYRCNLSCVYCYQGKGELVSKSMDEKTAQCVIQFIKGIVSPQTATLGIQLFGGEPFLNMPVNMRLARELNAWCEETGKTFSLSAITNGTLLTPEYVEQLAGYNCRVMVVLDGPQKIHDTRKYYKNGRGTFDDILEGLHRVREHNLSATVRINVDETNKDYIPSLLKFLKDDLNTVKISIKPVFSTSPACMSYSGCIPAEMEMEVQDQLYRTARNMGFTVEQPEKPTPLGACAAETVSCFTVDPYLRLFTCAIMPPFEENVAGIIRPEDAKPVFTYVYTDFLSRDPLALNQCRTCNLVPVCRGGCPAEVFKMRGTTHGCLCNKPEVYKRLEELLVGLAKKYSP